VREFLREEEGHSDVGSVVSILVAIVVLLLVLFYLVPLFRGAGNRGIDVNIRT